MKKTYLPPFTVMMDITTNYMVAASDGDQINEKVTDDQIDGDKAWSRRRRNRQGWEDEEEEEDW